MQAGIAHLTVIRELDTEAQTKQKPTKTEHYQKIFVSLPPNSDIMYSLIFHRVSETNSAAAACHVLYHEYGIFITFSLNIAWILQKKQYLCTQIRRAVLT